MYTFVSAFLRKKGKNQRFEAVNLTNVKMSKLYSDYRDGYIELANVSLRNNIFVQLNDLKAASNLNYTDSLFPTWLAVQGSTTIFGSKVKPKFYSGHISFADAIQAGCKLRRVRQSDLEGKNSYPLDMMPDVFLNKTLADYTLLQKYILTTVNGLCHLNIPAARGILVRDAGKTLDISQDNHIGLISFETIGEIEQVIIRDENIQPLPVGGSYRQAVYLDLDRDLTNKTVMFSFCGRLFVADDIIERINDHGGIRINMGKLDIFQIVQDSISQIDLSSLELDERMYKANSLKLSDVLDDDTVLALLKLSQTFFVIVDTPTLCKSKHALAFTRLPGIYERFANAKLPYIDDHGLMHSYWKMQHNGAYSTVFRYHLKDTFYRTPLNQTGGYQEPGNWLNNSHTFTPRTDYHTGHLLDIFYERLVYSPV